MPARSATKRAKSAPATSGTTPTTTAKLGKLIREKHGKNAYDRAWFGVGDDDAVLKQYSGLRAYDNFYTELFEAPGSVD